MTPTLVRNQLGADASAPADAGTRARDWAEIQERMLAPLYEAVYDRMEIGAATRMLSLGCVRASRCSSRRPGGRT
ncbi:hypothetical protein GA0115255_1251610 [Streptomyces sp. Ncost-T6T-2b]|nr:hypothetical protein GA0115255_1251610 [Streptomyces sp. Ncost-T6T-2b]